MIRLKVDAPPHKQVKLARFQPSQAIREILLAGDTNRLVAELTFAAGHCWVQALGWAALYTTAS